MDSTGGFVYSGAVVNQNYTVDRHNLTLDEAYQDSYRYQPCRLVARIVRDADNLIEVEYKSDEWKYTVNYYVRLRNVVSPDGEKWLPTNFEANPTNVKVHSKELTTTSPSVTVPYDATAHELPAIFKLPTGYYLLVGYNHDASSNTLQTDSAALVQRENPVINFYIEPDSALITLTGGTEEYNGAEHHKTLDVQLESITGLEYTPMTQYWDLETRDASGNPTELKDGAAPTNAGSYAETAYIKATYTHKYTADSGEEHTETKTYLIWKSDDYDKSGSYLTVTPISITLQSASINEPYDGEVHKAEIIYVRNGAFIASDFTKVSGGIVSDGKLTADFVSNYVKFAVDAFRRNPGTTDNLFDMNFQSEELERNYDVTKLYGTLTVTES